MTHKLLSYAVRLRPTASPVHVILSKSRDRATKSKGDFTPQCILCALSNLFKATIQRSSKHWKV